MTDPEDELCGWVHWDDGTWSTLDPYGMPSERRTLEELLEELRKAEDE
ncbi:hypothetical protein GV791_20215 [Nocardia cyriacigeorgica]|uniref:Uncharacterized protein n=1 Tax=Nocardia cyriacigeorgica TaxID=135487 RepID=A0A6P1CUA0_9NOCA|nr:hypothetical protein [Nocardia cyriacigeorgica]MBF6424902.1 hypothetical protein [Nocardia cyriacigeorgica]NEW34866.1 hypothetical protein [Nocardia cyriacigeorgica]BDU03936.1 hypothetical protein FMUBM48_01990 [Nocardia cyriacigeorgica]